MMPHLLGSATTICFQNKKSGIPSETREKSKTDWTVEKTKQIKNSEKVKNDFVQAMAVAVAQR